MTHYTELMATESVVTPPDILAGLGHATRDLLATCIALFEDTKLSHRLGALYDKLLGKLANRADAAAIQSQADAVASVQSRTEEWQKSNLTDDQLRLVLWIYLRDAFALPSRVCLSMRSAMASCDDLAASALHFLKPGMLVKLKVKLGRDVAKDRPDTLDALARNTLAELLKSTLEGTTEKDAAAREELVAAVQSRVAGLSDEDRAKLLRAIGADRLNDAAIRKILLTGGGLAAFSTSVSLAGFSAYILAAQISAYVPLVSGPGLVSFVAVMSNPITALAATGLIAWTTTRSVDRRVRSEVGVRVMSLLALHGINSGRQGIEHMLRAFGAVSELRPFGDLDFDWLQPYRAEWESLKRAWPERASLDPAIAALMSRPAAPNISNREELKNAAALGVMTLGDVLYCAYAIDPTVMLAAGFARATDLSDPLAFADFAQKIQAMDPAGHLGAISDVKGYVAERVVAAQLIAHGHEVVFPETSNEPGWDIAVDGVKVQIKDASSLDYIARHFDKYKYEYPVVANSEVAQMLAQHQSPLPDWAHHVYFVEGYSNDVVQHVAEHSIAAGDGMLHPHVPVFTVIISAARNYSRMHHGEVTGSQALQQILLDGTTRMGLAAFGGFAGVSIGLLVFGPAGALIFGSVVPILTQMQSRRVQGSLDKLVTSQKYIDWQNETRQVLEALVVKLREVLETKAKLLKERLRDLHQDAAGEYLRWRLNDEIGFLREMWCRLDHLTKDKLVSIEIVVARVLVWVGASTIHPVACQHELDSLNTIFAKRPKVTERLAEHADIAAKHTSDAVKKSASWLREQWSRFNGKDQ